MENYIIIKINRPEFECDDYHDLICDKFDDYYNDIKKFAGSLGAKLFITESYAQQSPCEFAFDEVEHSVDLSKENKNKLIELVKKFFQDAQIERETIKGRKEIYLQDYNILKMVKFHKSADEIILLDDDKN